MARLQIDRTKWSSRHVRILKMPRAKISSTSPRAEIVWHTIIEICNSGEFPATKIAIFLKRRLRLLDKSRQTFYSSKFQNVEAQKSW